MDTEKRGLLYAWLFAMLEGLFPILSIFTLRYIGSLYAYAFSIAVATLFFVAYLHHRGKLHELISAEARFDLLMTALLINGMFVLIFIGLRYTTAANMSVIIILQLLFSYLYFNVFGSEKLGVVPTIGAFMMAVGGIYVVFPADFRFNKGDLMILAAAAIAPVANLYQKRARNFVSSETVLAFRDIAAIPIVLALALLFERPLSLHAFREALPFILLNGFLVFTLAKMLWIEALHFTSITKLSAMVSLIPVFTLLFSWLLLSQIPSMHTLPGIIAVVVGSLLISRKEQS